MGLFLTEDGHFQGWLAALLCCCAAVNEDEDPVERHYCKPSEQGGTTVRQQNDFCNHQPQPAAVLHAAAGSQDWNAMHCDNHNGSRKSTEQPSRSHDRPPSLKPLQLGSSSLLSRHLSGRKQNGMSASHRTRPSISTPTAFRRLDYTDRQHVSLVPLRLAPVVLKDTPPPEVRHWRPPSYISADIADHVLKRADSTMELSAVRNSIEESCQARSETSYERTRSLDGSSTRDSQSHQDQATSVVSDAVKDRSPRPTMSTRSSSSSLRRQAIEANAASTFPRFGSRSNSRERPTMKRKMSLQSLRRSYLDNGELDVDQEILELNTIVEEKRVESDRSATPNEHRPAIAPTMQVRARSETLTDIGSAFSRPHTARENSLPSLPTSGDMPAALNRTPALPRSRSLSRSRSRSSSRVSGWLSNLLHSSVASSSPAPAEPFYKCMPREVPHRRTYSERSLTSTLLTDLDSPALTLASSPTSKGHSRSITAESTIAVPPLVYHTPNTFTTKPPSPEDSTHSTEILHSPSEVGLAL